MLSLIQNQVVTVHGWIDDTTFTDIVAISQMTPGPIAINSATYVGYTVAGFWGSVVATVSVCLPALTLMILITRFFLRLRNNRYMKGAIAGMKPVVVGMIGAAVLSAYSALRSGSGLVTLVTAESQQQTAASFYPEIITCGVKDIQGVICIDDMERIVSIVQGSDAVVFGPGIGRGKHIFSILKRIVEKYSGTLIIDADGLNALAEDIEILNRAKGEIILTPHPGEMSRLTGLEIKEIQTDRVKIAEDFAKKHGVCVALKGYGTVVAQDGFDTYVNKTGNPGMATAGMGDVLSGVIGSLAGQGIKPFEAAKLGVYVHGMAGDLARCDKGEAGLIAKDVAEQIPYAIRRIFG